MGGGGAVFSGKELVGLELMRRLEQKSLPWFLWGAVPLSYLPEVHLLASPAEQQLAQKV